MRSLTVLGSCGAWPEAGRACAGFLLEYDGFTVVLDLGYAALPQLLRHRPTGGTEERVERGWLPAGPVRIGLTAGASTPNNKIGETIERILELRGVPLPEPAGG